MNLLVFCIEYHLRESQQLWQWYLQRDHWDLASLPSNFSIFYCFNKIILTNTYHKYHFIFAVILFPNIPLTYSTFKWLYLAISSIPVSVSSNYFYLSSLASLNCLLQISWIPVSRSCLSCEWMIMIHFSRSIFLSSKLASFKYFLLSSFI